MAFKNKFRKWVASTPVVARRVVLMAAVVALFTIRQSANSLRVSGSICVHQNTRCRSLKGFCLDNQDRFLVCDGARRAIRVITLDDKPVGLWRIGFLPQSVTCHEEGTVAVAGNGRIALLDRAGKVQRQARLPGKTVTSLRWSRGDIFVSIEGEAGYNIYRMSNDLKNPKLIVKDLHGCCGQMDFAVKDRVLYVAANGLFKVVKYNREGKELGRFGGRAGRGVVGFEGCCEPKNVCFDSRGYLYTAESSNGGVKRFTIDGKHVRSMGKVMGLSGCVKVTIAVTRDCSRLYMLDSEKNLLRMLKLAAGKDSLAT